MDIGQSGIFISDSAMSQLNIKMDAELLDALKKSIKEGKDEVYKCYITNQWVPRDKGVFIPPGLMADALEQNLLKAEELWVLYKKENVVIQDDGSRIDANALSKTEKKNYEIRINVPFIRKTVFSQYIKMLRKNARK